MNPARLGVVLVRPKLSANLGSVARVVKNFGVRDLRLVEPAALGDDEARRLASGADDVLVRAHRFDGLSAAVADFEVVLSTSSLRGRVDRRVVDLADLPRFLAELGDLARVALVFGPERSGLTEEELARSSALLTISTAQDFPTMNLSHAVAVALAAARLGSGPAPGQTDEPWAPSGDIEAMIEHWDRALDAIGFYDTGHRDRTLRDWRRLVAGRPVTQRDVAILRGVANRILVALKRS
jgi:TrmH family RNA methyltransferase